MIEYLKSVIGKQLEEQEAETMKQSEVDDSTLLEYASLFQELDDLTLHGDGTAPAAVEVIETTEREPINIPLESYDPDIEIQTIEMDVTDGRVINIPSDATVTESTNLTEEEQDQKDIEEIEEQYVGMKTYMDFFNEAAAEVCRLPRESDSRYAARIDAYIAESWREYNEQLYQESLFGHGKIQVNDLSVPDKIHMNFGKGEDGGKEYTATLPIKWQIDKKGCITKNQLDAVQVWAKFGKMSLNKMTDTVLTKVCEKYKEDTKKKKWDILTPVVVCVPIEPTDEYNIVIGFETDFSKETEYFEFSVPVKSIKVDKKNENVPENVSGKIQKYASGDAEKNMVRKRDYKLEMMEGKVNEEEDVVTESTSYIPKRHSRFYQEAIDFGGGAAAGAADATAAPPAVDATGGDANAAPATPDATGGTDPNANGMDPNANPADPNAAATDPDANAAPEQPAPDAEPANVNDVSDQIADKVAQKTEDQVNSEETPTDDTSDVDATAGNTEETPTEETPDAENIGDVDSEIDSLGSESGDETPADDTTVTEETPEDLDDLTMDQLIAQGSEKLKSMTIGQLKEFINSPDGTTPEEVKEENPIEPVDEANEDTTTESVNIELLDEKVMMENFFTDASNIRERITAAIEDVVPGLKKIQKNCLDGNWDRFELKKFWRDVPDKSGVELESGRTGTQFCSQISDLRHFLNVTKKKRAKDAFTVEQLSKLNDFNIKLDQFSHLCDKACKSFRVKYDISMKDVAEDAAKTLEMCNDVKDMVTSEEFSECYYQEALFVTRKNVSNYVLDHVASSLGILNNTEMPFQQLVVAFKKEAKRTNKILNKASKMKCYSDEEKNEIKKLNVRLMELASYIRMNNLNDAYTNRVKRAIKGYVAQSRIVTNIMEKHADPKKLKKQKLKRQKIQESVVETDVVQEAMGCSASLTNIKNQIMNSVPDEFEVGGGGYTPTVKLTSKIVPSVAVTIKENGRNIDLVPEVNNVPDFVNVRRGIAINGAAQTIIQFARDLVNKFKTTNKVQECGDTACGSGTVASIPSAPSTVKEEDTPSMNDTSVTTADTTTGTDVSTSGTADFDSLNSAASDAPSGTSNDTAMSSTEPMTSTGEDAPPTSVNEEAELERQFNEFMNSY